MSEESKLKVYSLNNPSEKEVTELFLEFLGEFGVASYSRSNNVGQITGSCLILNPQMNKVLLTHHRKLDMWLQLGGHDEGEYDSYFTAKREAAEESGISHFDNFYQGEIVDLDRHKIPERKNELEHYHYDVRYVFVAKNEDFKISDESNDLRWFSFDDLAELNLDESLLRLISKVQNLKKQ